MARKLHVRTWHCGEGHTFDFGNEEWHYWNAQGFLFDGSPIPRYCTEDFDSLDYPDQPGMWGEPCMDSTSLVYD